MFANSSIRWAPGIYDRYAASLEIRHVAGRNDGSAAAGGGRDHAVLHCNRLTRRLPACSNFAIESGARPVEGQDLVREATGQEDRDPIGQVISTAAFR
jgi:hypothetical protein